MLKILLRFNGDLNSNSIFMENLLHKDVNCAEISSKQASLLLRLIESLFMVFTCIATINRSQNKPDLSLFLRYFNISV